MFAVIQFSYMESIHREVPGGGEANHQPEKNAFKDKIASILANAGELKADTAHINEQGEAVDAELKETVVDLDNLDSLKRDIGDDQLQKKFGGRMSGLGGNEVNVDNM